MIPFILGGIALVVTGYGIKKYLEDENNCKKLENIVCCWIDKVENKISTFITGKRFHEFFLLFLLSLHQIFWN